MFCFFPRSYFSFNSHNKSDAFLNNIMHLVCEIGKQCLLCNVHTENFKYWLDQFQVPYGCYAGLHYLFVEQMHIYIYIYRVIQKDVLHWKVNVASTNARQLVAVFKVLCPLYGLTCVGYAHILIRYTQKILCYIVACSQLLLLHGYALGERSSDVIWTRRISSSQMLCILFTYHV